MTSQTFWSFAHLPSGDFCRYALTAETTKRIGISASQNPTTMEKVTMHYSGKDTTPYAPVSETFLYHPLLSLPYTAFHTLTASTDGTTIPLLMSPLPNLPAANGRKEKATCYPFCRANKPKKI